ncbi:hypothetical protein ACGGZK_16065 [Agromyces sp. MMS24-K17]|uniref:hypothetical protein n=1 Tax=Agromyces sp. MMS24-K17 TaxID=3372850 RepID=UPI0037547225
MGGVFLLGTAVGVTSAAWVDPVGFTSAVASTGTFDIQARFASNEEGLPPGGSTAPWEDIGLPGDPDTYLPGFEIQIPPISGVLPSHAYFGDVFLCNAGTLDGMITGATFEEVTVDANGVSTRSLVVAGSIEVDGIDIGTVIPAGSCEPPEVEDPANDVEGVIHFTTVDDFSGVYGATSTIVIRIEVMSR